jgi:signal transduction histidine kinase
LGATEQLEEVSRDLEAFSYSVSHDLRAPLRAVKGFGEMLRNEHAEDLGQEGLRLTNLILRNADRMGLLIADLLSFAQVGRGGISRATIDMTMLVRSVIDELQSRESFGGIEFRWSLLRAVGDEAMIRQVWMNLLANALKFTLPKGVGRIEVSSEFADGESVYRVKDSGVVSMDITPTSSSVSFSGCMLRRISRAPVWGFP